MPLGICRYLEKKAKQLRRGAFRPQEAGDRGFRAAGRLLVLAQDPDREGVRRPRHLDGSCHEDHAIPRPHVPLCQELGLGVTKQLVDTAGLDGELRNDPPAEE